MLSPADRRYAIQVYQSLTYNALIELEGIAEHGTDYEPNRVITPPLVQYQCIKPQRVEGWPKLYYVITPFGQAVLDVKSNRLKTDSPEARKLRDLERQLNELRDRRKDKE